MQKNNQEVKVQDLDLSIKQNTLESWNQGQCSYNNRIFEDKSFSRYRINQEQAFEQINEGIGCKLDCWSCSQIKDEELDPFP